MNRAPMAPPTTPIMQAATMASRYISSLLAANFTVPEFISLILSSPSASYLRMVSMKVLILDAKNTFQVKENDQKVLGFEIS